MAEVFNVSLRPNGTDMVIPVQRGISKASQAEALKSVYPKSMNPTVNMDKLSIYMDAGNNQAPKIAKQLKAVANAVAAGTGEVKAGVTKAAAKTEAPKAPPVQIEAKAPEAPEAPSAYNAAGAAPKSAGGKFSFSA